MISEDELIKMNRTKIFDKLGRMCDEENAEKENVIRALAMQQFALIQKMNSAELVNLVEGAYAMNDYKKVDAVMTRLNTSKRDSK